MIIHGFTADPSANWFPWLSETFSAAGVEVRVPAMPNTMAPELGPWVDTASAAIGEVDDDLVIVGHSLGCITALHALARAEGAWKLGGLVMVAGFDAPQTTLPELDEFTADVPDLAAIASRTRYRRVIASDDDGIVPPSASAELATHLLAPLETVRGAGHFLDRDGHLAVPSVKRCVEAAFAPG